MLLQEATFLVVLVIDPLEDLAGDEVAKSLGQKLGLQFVQLPLQDPGFFGVHFHPRLTIAPGIEVFQ